MTSFLAGCSDQYRDPMSGYEKSRSGSKDRGRRNSSTHRHRGDDRYTSTQESRLQSLPIRSGSQNGGLNSTTQSATSSSSTKSYGPSASRTAQYGLASSRPLGASGDQNHTTRSSLSSRERRASIDSTENRPMVPSRPSVSSILSRESSGNDPLMFQMSEASSNSSRASLSSRRISENESRGRSRFQVGATARRASSSDGYSTSSRQRLPLSAAFRATPPTGRLWGGDSSSSAGTGSSSRASVSSRATNAAPSASGSMGDWDLSAYGRPRAGESQSRADASYQRRPSAASNISDPFSGPAIDIPNVKHSVRVNKHDPRLFPGTGWTPEYENGAWNSWKEESVLRTQREDYKANDKSATRKGDRYKEELIDASSVSSSAGLGKSASTDLSAESMGDSGLKYFPLPKKNMSSQQRKSIHRASVICCFYFFICIN